VKRLGVLGTFVWDTIWTLEDQAAGRAFETWGGMAYSLAAGAAAVMPGWEIVPIAKVGSDLIDEAHRFLDTLPNIGRRSAMIAVSEANNRVELRYTEAARRGERLTGGVGEWTWDELAPHLAGLDAIHVNYFSGFELGLAATERLAAEFSGRRYADLHSLFLGCPGAGARQPRRLPEWERWAGAYHVVQVNEDEYALMAGRRLQPGEAPRELLCGDAQVALVTLGAEGAAYATRAEESGRVPAPVAGGADPTGCGDVWGVTVCAGLVGGLSVPDAVARGNAMAAVKMEHRGATGLHEHLAGRADAWAIPISRAG
jgi:sugar/nucleoside kinase (ribokinase family)